jgi:hypothetical protein
MMDTLHRRFGKERREEKNLRHGMFGARLLLFKTRLPFRGMVLGITQLTILPISLAGPPGSSGSRISTKIVQEESHAEHSRSGSSAHSYFGDRDFGRLGFGSDLQKIVRLQQYQRRDVSER